MKKKESSNFVMEQATPDIDFCRVTAVGRWTGQEGLIAWPSGYREKDAP
jgi:hypothetical protein